MLRRRWGSSVGWPLGILGNKAWVHFGIKHSFFFFFFWPGQGGEVGGRQDHGTHVPASEKAQT